VTLNTEAVSTDVAPTSNNLTSLTTVTLNGNGIAFVENEDGSKLATVEASGLDSTINAPYTFNENDAGVLFGVNGELVLSIFEGAYEIGDKSFGLILNSKNASVAETITLGDSVDIILSNNSSTFEKMDVINNLNLVVDASGELTNQSDVLWVNGVTDFEKLSPSDITYTGNIFELYLTEVAALDVDEVVFQFGGNTYVYVDKAGANDILDFDDTVIELTGLINLDALVASLNYTV